jgi:hypothetical protein
MQVCALGHTCGETYGALCAAPHRQALLGPAHWLARMSILLVDTYPERCTHVGQRPAAPAALWHAKGAPRQ